VLELVGSVAGLGRSEFYSAAKQGLPALSDYKEELNMIVAIVAIGAAVLAIGGAAVGWVKKSRSDKVTGS
jgi:hypothetical protein